MRSCVISAFALAVALVPAASFGQATTTSGQPPTTGQPPAGQQPPATTTPAAPAAHKVPFDTPAGILLVQIKKDKTADFEEMMGKLRAGIAKSSDETLKKQGAGMKVYKSTEPGPNVIYVLYFDPAVPASEYELFNMLLRTMTPDEQRAEGVQDMWKRYADAFAAGLNKLSLVPVGG